MAIVEGTWTHVVDSDPNGTATIDSGSDRCFAMYWVAEHGAGDPVPVITVGGQAETAEYLLSVEDGGDDMYAFWWLWDETAIAAMSGSSISHTDGEVVQKRGWGYVTLTGVNQSTFPKGQHTAIQQSNQAALDVTTTSSATDRVLVASMNKGNRTYSSWDTLTERQDATLQSGNARVGVASGDGGDDTTTVQISGVSNWVLHSIVLQPSVTGQRYVDTSNISWTLDPTGTAALQPPAVDGDLGAEMGGFIAGFSGTTGTPEVEQPTGGFGFQNWYNAEQQRIEERKKDLERLRKSVQEFNKWR